MQVSDEITADDIINKDILELIGANLLTDDQKQELHAKMLETVRFRVMAAIDDILSDDQRGKLQDLLSQPDDALLGQFFIDNEINVEQMMVDEALKYKIEILTYVNFLKQTGKAAADLYEVVSQQGEE